MFSAFLSSSRDFDSVFISIVVPVFQGESCMFYLHDSKLNQYEIRRKQQAMQQQLVVVLVFPFLSK
jgi:hypothetical protein